MSSRHFRLNGPRIDLIEELGRLVDAVKDDPDVDWEYGSVDGPSVSDVITGAFWAACDCYNGMGDPLYSLQCRIRDVFTPARCSSGPEPETSEEDAYDSFCRAFLAGV